MLSIEDNTEERRADENLASVHIGLRNFIDAIQCDKQLLIVVKEVGDMAGQERAYRRLRIACRNLGNLDEAIEYRKQELSIV